MNFYKLTACCISLLGCFSSLDYSNAMISSSISETQAQNTIGISLEKLSTVNIECFSFLKTKKEISLTVVDVIVDDVIAISEKLCNIQFPIYAMSCHNARLIQGSSSISLHAYGCAIDINDYMNPCYDVLSGAMIPPRENDREKDATNIVHDLMINKMSDAEIAAVLNAVIQPNGSDDRFLNRGILRPGMITPEVVSIFNDHGFNIWGGNWRQPMDYMHFQTPRIIAEKLSSAESFEERKEIWKRHKESIK